MSLTFRTIEDGTGPHGTATDHEGKWMGSWYECMNCPKMANRHLEYDKECMPVARESQQEVWNEVANKWLTRTERAMIGRLCIDCYIKARVAISKAPVQMPELQTRPKKSSA